MASPADAARPDVQAVIDAVGSPIRREILWMVWQNEMAAGDIAAAFEVTAPTISAHLTALRSAGLVTRRADGNFRRYRADREAMALVVPLLASGNERWLPADDIPERELAAGTVELWVQVSVDLANTNRVDAFDAFVDEQQYSQWLGVPVTIRDGRFATELEWGTRVRGHYEVIAPPDLIALRWDFEDDAVPVPGRQLVAYLRFADRGRGCRIEVHQHASTRDQSEFLLAAWSLVLGRLRQHVDPDVAPRPRRPRPPRTKRTSSSR